MIRWIVLFLLGIPCLLCQTPDLIAEKSVTCSSDSMIVRFRFQKPFAGSIFTERGFSHEKCHWSGASNLEVNVQVPILNTTECGVAFNQETGEFAVKLIVSPVDGLIVDGFSAVNVRCIYLTQDITLTLPANQDGKHALSISGSTIEGSVVTGTGGAPLLSMQILEGHGITGQPVARASVGQRITLDILLKDTSIYDFYVHSCFAHDGTASPDASIQIIDTHGCGVRLSRAVDVPVLTSAAIDGGQKHVYLHMYGFQFTSSQFVHFECQVKPCVHSCKRQQCETPTSSVPLIPARRRRDGWQENSVSSLTDEKVGEAMENLRLSTVLQIEPQRAKRAALVWSSEDGLDGCPSIRLTPLLIAAAGLIVASVISTLAFIRLFSKSRLNRHSTKS
ncbi:unnamed protein product, partial [Mesorhabditis belari]|uniref:ZP domain-containing protein n=1 Tax=Mesorhabditis belari TaxID=2138241 RepID=A0AAF3EB01_9BILA